MSGSPIRTTLRVSAEVQAAARQARESARRARTAAIERRARAATAAGVADTRSATVEARMELLAEERVAADPAAREECRVAYEAGDVVRAERALDAAEAAVDAQVERIAVHREVMQRAVAELPESMRVAVGSMQPAPSGALSVEALRPTEGRLGLEVAPLEEDDRVAFTFHVADARLHPPTGSRADQCAHEEAAVEQIVDRFAAAGLDPSALERDSRRKKPARRKRVQAPKAREAGA